MVPSTAASHRGPDATPDNHTTTTFDCEYDVIFFIKHRVYFRPDVMGHKPICSQNSWGSSSRFLLANVSQAFVLFLVRSSFLLGSLPWMQFFLASILLFSPLWVLL